MKAGGGDCGAGVWRKSGARCCVSAGAEPPGSQAFKPKAATRAGRMRTEARMETDRLHFLADGKLTGGVRGLSAGRSHCGDIAEPRRDKEKDMTMKPLLPVTLLSLAAIAGVATAAPTPARVAAAVSAPAPAAAPPVVANPNRDDFYAHADWDDDDDDRRRYGRMTRPDMGSLRAVGIVRVTEVERDDGRIEVEGRDARGREIDVLMDAQGRRVLDVRRDSDDRWDD